MFGEAVSSMHLRERIDVNVCLKEKQVKNALLMQRTNNNWIARCDPWDPVHFPQSFISLLFPDNSSGLHFSFWRPAERWG